MIDLYWYTGWPGFITDPKFSMRWEGKLVPTETGTYRFNMKSFGPRRVYLDGKEVAHNYDSMESYTVPVELVAGKEYDFAFETSNAVLGAFRAQMFWKTPADSRPRGEAGRAETEDTDRLSAGRESVDRFLDRRDAGRRRERGCGCSHRQDSADGQGGIHRADGAVRSILHGEAGRSH